MEGQAGAISKKRLWVGRIMSGLAVLFLLFDSSTKLLRVEAVMKAAAQIGYPPSTMPPIGLILLVCVVVYLIPRTAVLGAVLLTGYLGGAVATHVRVGDPLMSHILFPIYFAVLIWGGLYLRDGRVQALFARRDPPR
jgi:ABC-type transport system involved in cytochrome c biogenesis permease component